MRVALAEYYSMHPDFFCESTSLLVIKALYFEISYSVSKTFVDDC